MTLGRSPLTRAAPQRAVVKSADRALDVIEHVAACSTPPTFKQIALALAVPKSSLSQLLSNLVTRGYVEIVEGLRYRLGPRLAELSRAAAIAIPVEERIQRVLDKLRDELNETTGFYVRRGDEVELAASAASRHALVYIMNTGERAPLYAISPGKIILASMGEEEFAAYLERIQFQDFTPTTIGSRAMLRKEIAAVRREGFAHAHGEYSQGIRGLAIGVSIGDRLVGAVNVSVPMVRFDDRLEAAIRHRLRIVSADLARIFATS